MLKSCYCTVTWLIQLRIKYCSVVVVVVKAVCLKGLLYKCMLVQKWTQIGKTLIQETHPVQTPILFPSFGVTRNSPPFFCWFSIIPH